MPLGPWEFALFLFLWYVAPVLAAIAIGRFLVRILRARETRRQQRNGPSVPNL
jgi:hypothetical protein